MVHSIGGLDSVDRLGRLQRLGALGLLAVANDVAVREPKRLLEPVRLWLRIDVFVLAAAGIQCFLLATATDRWFAWSVSPPISAAVLGAGYFGSVVMVVEARRASRWVDARVVIVSTFIFASLTLVVTLLHLPKFHFETGASSARAAAVGWLVVYAVVPPIVLWLLVLQGRTPGVEPVRVPPRVSRPVQLALVAEGFVLLALGAVLFGRGKEAEFWPWTLTDLTAQAIAAWLISLGALLLMCARELELARVRAALHSVVAAAVLWIVALLRFRGEVRWDNAGAVSVAVLVTLIVTVAAALRRKDGATGVAGFGG